MRRDSIFYQFFQQTPTLIFDLLPEAPLNASSYRFDSVAVKEASETEIEETRRGIIEMITTIVVYKFTNPSRQETEAMLASLICKRRGSTRKLKKKDWLKAVQRGLQKAV